MDRASAEITVDSTDLGMGTGQAKYGWKRDPESREYWITRIMEKPAAVAEFTQANYQSKENEALRYRANNVDGGYPYLKAKVDELGKALATYQAAQGDIEATVIGRALIKLFQTFGYKKG